MLTKSSSKSSSLLTLPTFEMLKSKQSKAEVKKKKFKMPYKKGRCLGKGKTAIVFAGKHRKTKERVALKYFIFNDFNDKHPGYVERELGIQKKFDHPNILKVYDIIDYKGNPLLVMERAEGNLLDFMQNRAYMYFDNMVRSIIRQVLSALVHIHQLGFVHRDIKPGNILVGAKGVIKVADFGFTRSIRYTLAGSKAVSGTPDFMPPECYVGDRVYNEKFDIWSTGVTLCYLLLRRRPVDLKPKKQRRKRGNYASFNQDW
eukprot:CAMPEP_0168535342 /NCGR_PEP_ID=MMETSP0405-20121227/18600_1 /TAXON_ID=498012 /ORGANISM="Trichosphaerium sp, Strain Am-I-7 wt" /LENGTH=258 /DNA_ID=CAMNT_0008562545 /DNA_START=45 /DNA_END=821 /DNA_ORIENTATION=-